MKKIFLLLVLLIFSSYLFSKDIIQGRVIKVTDGDTMTVLTKNNKQIKVRLYGIDCPEKGQDYYQVAKNYLATAVHNKNVRVEVQSKDRYQRTVGIIWHNNTNINLNLIQQGLAWHYTDFDKSQSFANAQEKAKTAKINIWSKKKPVAPWEFRKSKKRKNK